MGEKGIIEGSNDNWSFLFLDTAFVTNLIGGAKSSNPLHNPPKIKRAGKTLNREKLVLFIHYERRKKPCRNSPACSASSFLITTAYHTTILSPLPFISNNLNKFLLVNFPSPYRPTNTHPSQIFSFPLFYFMSFFSP